MGVPPERGTVKRGKSRCPLSDARQEGRSRRHAVIVLMSALLAPAPPRISIAMRRQNGGSVQLASSAMRGARRIKPIRSTDMRRGEDP